MKTVPLKWLLAIGAMLGSGPALAQTLTLDKQVYEPADEIAVTFADGPGNAKDWIGIFRAEELPGGPPATRWNYVDGTRDGLVGHTSGTLTFPGTGEEGEWIAYLLENDSYNYLALATFTVVDTSPAITPGAQIVATGQPITIDFIRGPGNAKDWIGIYKEGEVPGPDTPSTIWAYVDGTQDGNTGVSDGSVTLTEGLTVPGEYVAHFLENDGYTSLATATFTVVDDLPFVLAHHSNYFPEEPIVVTFGNGPGNPLDWVGVYYADEIPDGEPPSITWSYVGGSQTAGAGVANGTVTLGSLPFAGDYDVFLLENDGYSLLATNRIHVVDPFMTVVRLNKRIFYVDEDITAEFFNTPGNAKDWLAVYQAGEVPDGTPPSIIWSYVDGTQEGTTPVITGTVTFAGGLSEPGEYEIHLLADDGYTILGTESFRVIEPAGAGVRIVSVSPVDGSTNQPPIVAFRAALTNTFAALNEESVELTLNGAEVPATVTMFGTGAVIEYSNTELPAPGSTHNFVLKFSDTATPVTEVTEELTYTIGQYRDISLPEPIHFNNFDSVPEGELPPGWTEVHLTPGDTDFPDLGDLNSGSYNTWVTVAADRFLEPLLGYSMDPTEAYERVNLPNPFNVLDGQVYNQPLASGNMLFGNSGYRNGSQVLYLFSPDFDLTGHTDVHVAFHSLWEQNQDSLASLEYSIDGGETWLPIIYMLHGPDILRNGDAVDAVATFNAQPGDVATWLDPETFETRGGTYGSFIGAEISNDLAPFLSARLDDNATDSKRIELFRLPQADNQATVRFRFAHAGSDSWYWGIDNFGLYSIPAATEEPRVNATRTASGQITISWDAAATGFTLQSTANLSDPDWQTVSGVQNNSITLDAEGLTKFFRLVK